MTISWLVGGSECYVQAKPSLLLQSDVIYTETLEADVKKQHLIARKITGIGT